MITTWDHGEAIYTAPEGSNITRMEFVVDDLGGQWCKVHLDNGTAEFVPLMESASIEEY